MKFRSLLVRWARTALFLPLHVFGIWEESQQVSVQLKTPLLEAVSSASVQICPKELQVYSAWLHVEPDLTGLRGFIAHHPYLAGMMNVLLICALEGLALHHMLKKLRVKHPVESGNKQSVEISSKERNKKHIIRLVESLQPLPESQCVNVVPKDFSHLLLPEPSKQTWLATLGCNTKKKVS